MVRSALSYPAIAMAVLAVIAGGCSTGPSHSDEITGIIAQVTGELGSVESFIVLDDEGASHQFAPTPGLLFYGGPLDHLRDHIITGQRIVVTFEEGAYGKLTAVLIEHEDRDAPHEQADR